MSIVYPPVGSTGSEKIDNKATLGLLGTANSLAYRVHEIARHLHSGAAWFEEAGTPSATHFADRIGTSGGGGAFQIDAGNNDWGSWVQILGSDDTPVRSGMVYFDPHLFIVEEVERAATYFVQIGRGASGAAALSAGTYTELVYAAVSNKDTGEIPVQTGRAPAGSLLWARCMCPGNDTATLDFYFGVHEYEGV
jgi:hypothetical protein